MKNKRTQTRNPTAKSSNAFSAAERAAIKERVRETRRPRGAKKDGESELLAKIAEMEKTDRGMAQRVHAVVKAAAPELESTTWYGMPAYTKAGKVVCFFQPARKFKTRYATFGFNEPAHLDDGNMWPVAYALQALTPGDEKKISALVKKAVR
jgi:uncharacterized protein YdhG (YjbR/CyaY superfamily)